MADAIDGPTPNAPAGDGSTPRILGSSDVSAWAISQDAKRLLPKGTPICGVDGRGQPEVIGSGVLLRAAEMTVLVSAGHVADHGRQRALSFDVGGHLEPLPSAQWSVEPAPGLSRTDDRIDLAFWVIDPVTANRLASAHFVVPTQLDHHPDVDSEEMQTSTFLVIGWPSSQQPRQATAGGYRARGFVFAAKAHPSHVVRRLGLEPADSLFLTYARDHMHGRTGVRVGPGLHGVSGGGVWRRGAFGVAELEPKLAGIAIEWRQGDPEGIVVTRIAHLRKVLADTFPSLRDAMLGRRSL